MTLGAEASFRRKSVYGKTRRDVQDQLAATLRDQRLGLIVTGRRQTVEQFIERWLVDVVTPSTRASTLRHYRQMSAHAIEGVGRVPLERLTPQHVKRCSTQKPAAVTRTVHHVRAVLRERPQSSDALGIRRPERCRARRAAAGPTIEAKFLDVDQARRFLAAVKGDPLEALYCIVLSLGLRPGEALGVRWTDLDLAHRRILVHSQLQRVDGVLQLVERKATSRPHPIPLPDLAVTALQEHRAQQRVVALDGLVFTTSKGTPFIERNVVRSFKRHLGAAGLPDIRFYDLRHSAGALLIDQGVHPRIVMETLGHSQISTTMNLYGHVMPGDRTAANAMDQALGG